MAGAPLRNISVEYLADCDFLDCSVFGGWPYLGEPDPVCVFSVRVHFSVCACAMWCVCECCATLRLRASLPVYTPQVSPVIPTSAYEFIMQSGGAPYTDSYGPYCCGDGTCYPCMLNKNVTFCGPPPEYCNACVRISHPLLHRCVLPLFAAPRRTGTSDKCPTATHDVKLSGWSSISKNETEIAAQLVALGPLSVAMDAAWLDTYTGMSDCGDCYPSHAFDVRHVCRRHLGPIR
jgi:hypothetical protein